MNSLLLVLLFLSHGLTFKSSKSKCRIVPLVARRKIGADTILSASVQSFYLNNKDGPFSGKLKVRKVFRGGGAEKQAEERRTGVSSREDNDGVFLEGRSIIVEGLGDPDICVSTPRLGDTKLFFLDLVDPAVPRYKLHSSILRLSLKNLKVLWNLEKGEGGDSKCTAACQFGGVCLNGICTCQDKCTAKPYPICAKDGKTYKSKCDLKMAECLAQRSIPPSNFGTCTQEIISTSFLVESPGNLSREDTRGCPSGTWVGVSGCRPCLCSKYGSEGSVCDRLTGQCRCLPGYAGHTCQVCQGGSNELSCRESREAGQHRDGNLFQPNIEKGVALRERGRSNRRGESERGKAMMPFSHSVEMNDGYMSDRTRNAISVFGTLGNLCKRDSDCSARDSTCISSVCECKGGYVQESPYSCKIMYPGPCMYTPCEAGGTCEEHDGTFTCYCSSDRSGKYCEKAKQVQEAGFSGASYVTLRYLPSSVTSTTLDLEIKPYSPEGILLIARQNQNGKGDFFSIYLKKGHVEVKYDLGSGPVTLTSSTPVNLGAWNKLAVKRYRQDCMVALNGGEPVTSSARGRNKSLNLRSYAFIGGIPASNFSGIFGMVGTTENFQGCIREVGTRGRGISLVSDSEPLLLSSHNISECSELACSRFSCKHGGTCSLRSSKPRCSCPQGFRGRRCNKRKKEKRRHKKRKYFSKVQIPFLKNKKEYKRYKYTIN